MKQKILISTILFLSVITSTFAVTSAEIQVKYENILAKIEQQYSEEKFFRLLWKIDDRVDEYLEDRDISSQKRWLLLTLKSINQSKRAQNTINTDIVVNQSSALRKQEIIEATTRKNLQSVINEYSRPSFIQKFLDKWYEFVGVNPKFELVKWNEIQKISFASYIALNESNANSLLRKEIFSDLGDTIIFDGTNYYIPQWRVDYITKTPYSKADNIFQSFIDEDNNYVLEDRVYYTYIFDKFVYFPDKYGFYRTELLANSINPEKTILLYEGWGYKMVKDFTKKKLISESIVSELSDTAWFLSVVAKDSRYTDNADNDIAFRKLKNVTSTLTADKSPVDTIQAIYDYVLDNHYYYQDFKDGTQDIFSGIDTFQNGYGVCDGYSKLMYYMLAFAWISDIEHIRWYVIDAPDFPDIWHAWVRIWDKYYDPTFDDPVWATKTRSSTDYRYFRLPKDLAYTNRIDGFNASDTLQEMSLTERENLVESNLFSLTSNYSTNSYNLLKPFQVRNELGIWAWERVTLESLTTKLPFYKVDGKDFSFTNEQWMKKQITNIKYYIATDENLSSIIEALWESFVDTTLLLWDIWWWKNEYRIAYEITIR